MVAALSLRSNPHRAKAAVPPGPGSSVEYSLTYGAHVALSTAIGFLFLGEGQLSFGTRREQVAALLIAVLPPFPTSSTDNCGHHPALRHLYALAAEPRCFEAVDVQSGNAVHVPVVLELGNEKKVSPPESNQKMGIDAMSYPPGPSPSQQHAASPGINGELLSTPALQLLDAQLDRKRDEDHPSSGLISSSSSSPSDPKHTLVTPGMLPDQQMISSLVLSSPRYWPLRLSQPQLDAVLSRRQLWVQSNGKALPYALDPGGVRSLLGRVRRSEPTAQKKSAQRTNDGTELAEMAELYGEPGWVVSFARELCGLDSGLEDWIAAGLAGKCAGVSNHSGLGAWARGHLLSCIGQRRAAEVLPAALDDLVNTRCR